MADNVYEIDVNRDVRTVYGYWDRIESLPELMDGLLRVRKLDGDGRRRAEGRGEPPRASIVRVTDREPHRRIVWEARDGEALSGSATFEPLTDRQSRIRLRLLRGTDGTARPMPDRFGRARRRISRGLEDFKFFVERDDWPPRA